ncbi:MAG: GGDEF domain-containing protein [Chthoniobacterales bacterium]|nr:GGDEF domain-containing protein [Chthoniobacterales bacterium]
MQTRIRFLRDCLESHHTRAGVNDAHGHASGDAVLKDVAYLVRKRLRAFDLAYRLGGDELLILVPGADLKVAEAVGQSLHEAVSSETLGGGVRVTMSCGVSASRRDEIFDFDAVFRSADAALYEAKHCGGDRVRSDAPDRTPFIGPPRVRVRGWSVLSIAPDRHLA